MGGWEGEEDGKMEGVKRGKVGCRDDEKLGEDGRCEKREGGMLRRCEVGRMRRLEDEKMESGMLSR